ncbi:MAG: beta-lactamase family protein, partial [Clostridia bacterium]|nr:beta-lactamase family protein [Clostridia bacterium]
MEKRFIEFFRQVEDYVSAKKVPGAVAAVGRGDEIFGIRTFGNAIITPVVEPMTENTLFDIASLSKLTGTWAPLITLLQEGKVKLDAYLPDVINRKLHPSLEKVRVFNLLTHTSCLIPSLDVYEYGESREERMDKLLATTQCTSINKEVVYNDP